MNYDEALAWLYGLQRFGIKLGLENIRRLIDELEVAPETTVIHVAGTNGKGSVCAIIDAIARAAGIRSGLYTSPHLVTFRERIRVNGEMISREEVAHGLTTIRNLIATWNPQPTFFEIATALALAHFKNKGCEVIVLETGLGGRLDATNAVDSQIAVITPIDFDHQQFLGDTIEQIAAEKAGIIKRGQLALSAQQPDSVADVLRARAAEVAVDVQFVPFDLPVGLHVNLRGAHQRANAALAIAAAKTVLPITANAIGLGLADVEWPGRFQIWSDKIVIDGAHNPAGARARAGTWQQEFGDDRAKVILAVLDDKAADEIVNILAPIAREFVLPKIRGARAIEPEALRELVASVAPNIPATTSPNVSEALAHAQRQDGRALVTGSLHFVGEVLAHLGGEPDALEECMQ